MHGYDVIDVFFLNFEIHGSGVQKGGGVCQNKLFGNCMHSLKDHKHADKGLHIEAYM